MGSKSVLRSVTGAITCGATGNLASPAFSEATTLCCRSPAGSMGSNGGELSESSTSSAKRHELHATRTSRCNGTLRW
jgi:hypothetical protein